ncbi:MAG TPA: 4Fe-4S binding protein [Anaerolineales bacterium]|nr:4Fe-4S binding protein [Anaerolineales bacterium]
MYGLGIVRGLGVTLKHFLTTYVDDVRWFFGRLGGGHGRYYNEQALQARQGPKARGVFTVQYPEEKLPVPEEFRFLPFLVYDVGADGKPQDRCTSCGICAKVCPPQCIWIVRSNDPTTGRPVPEPTDFFIDIDICMNCGLCAEYCPFDAIKMDHDYELASFDRLSHHIFDKERLSKPASYYASIRPRNNAAEEAARAAKEAAKVAKAEPA